MVRVSLSGLSSVLSGGRDTIVARATAAGAGALAVIRVSGPNTVRIAECLNSGIDMGAPWKAAMVQLLDERGVPVEDAVVIPYRAPRSFTGEDMLELIVHGSTWIVDLVVETIRGYGARQAEPGEFTRRAVANGKMDLVQAEAVNDIIHAETGWQARLAREQMHGGLSREVGELREAFVAFLAEVEGPLDFEEQGAILDENAVKLAYEQCSEGVEGLLETASAGVRVREGARVVIVGAPNSGKSTLFNALLVRERAIVTPTPGTTRDVLEAEMEIEGIPVTLVDTAGLRETEDPAEREGVRRAIEEEGRADLVLVLHAVDQGGKIETGDPEERQMHVVTKLDLVDGPPGGVVPGELPGVSCVTGAGVERLRREIHRRVAGPVEALSRAVAVNHRHARALRRAKKYLDGVPSLPREVAAMEIRSAMAAVDEILGSVDDEVVLDRIFSSFCLGK